MFLGVVHAESDASLAVVDVRPLCRIHIYIYIEKVGF